MMSLKPHKITGRGMARTFQNLRLFKQMTVIENVKSGMHCRTSEGALGAMMRSPGQRRGRMGSAAPARSASPSSASSSTRTAWRATCPTATAARVRMTGRSPPSPGCCSSTSPPPA